MRREDILVMTRAVPFVPFRLTLTSGESYVVRHPDMIVPTLGAAFVGIPPAGGPADRAEDGVYVSLVHIVKIEPVPPAVPSANGTAVAP